MCVGARVRRSKRGLSHKVSLEVSSGVCGGQGSQIQKGAVTQGVAGGVVWCVWGQGPQVQDGAVTEGVAGGVVWCVWGVRVCRSKGGLYRRCRWRRRLVRVAVRVRRSKRGLSHKVSLEVSSGVCGVRVRRSKTAKTELSQRVSLEVSSGAWFRVRRSKRGQS